MRTRSYLAVLVVLGVLLSGCWDRAEIEDQSYIIVLGLDRGEQDELVVSALVALVQQLGAGTLETAVKPPDPELAVRLATARAGTAIQAIYILNGAMTRRLDLRHLRAVVVGEGLARVGLEPVLAELTRISLGRGSGLLAQARGSAYDVLSALQPVGEVNPARMVEGLNLQAKQLHLAAPARQHQFINRLAAGGVDPYLPVLAVNPEVAAGPQPPPEPHAPSALPGELPRGGGNPVELIGTAVFRRDRLAGFLNVDETQMLLALRGEMGKAYITFPDPGTPERPLTMRFHQENLPKYDAALRGQRPHVAEHMLLESELLSAPGGTDYSRPAARERLERAAADYVDRTTRGLLQKLRGWEADPVGFGLLFRNRFATWQQWADYDWPGRVRDLQVDVTAEMRLRRFGLILGRDRIRPETPGGGEGAP